MRLHYTRAGTLWNELDPSFKNYNEVRRAIAENLDIYTEVGVAFGACGEVVFLEYGDEILYGAEVESEIVCD